MRNREDLCLDAGEAIEAVPPEMLGKGRVEVSIRVEDGRIVAAARARTGVDGVRISPRRRA